MSHSKSSCCARGRSGHDAPWSADTEGTIEQIEPSSMAIPRRWSTVIGGAFLMGSNDRRFPEDGEGPVRQVTVAPFAIACHAVSNLQFGDFVRATDYTTDA